MRCSLCGSREFVEIFRQDSVPIWIDASDDDRVGKPCECVLNQCARCGHVYQPVGDALRAVFEQIYRSDNAQGTSPMGAGSWGVDRAERLFFSSVHIAKHRSAIEIGCGDGYLLMRLKERGMGPLIGIEPSINIRKNIDGITFINRFIDERLTLPDKVDLIFSIAVFEHIEALNDVLSFCAKHLNADGELFFVVPNAQRQLENGDPALFVHQHVHYFTDASIRHLLLRNGFEPTSVVATAEAFHVTAKVSAAGGADFRGVVTYAEYQRKVDVVVRNVQAVLSTGNVIVHGACNALNNIARRVQGDFALVDNDENKHGRCYFGRTVRSPAELDLGSYGTVLVMPDPYFEQIKTDYLKRGYAGAVVNPITERSTFVNAGP